MFLMASEERLGAEKPGRFRYAWLGVMGFSILAGLMLVGVWSVVWQAFLDWDRLSRPAAATAIVLLIGPLRRALVSLGPALHCRDRANQALAWLRSELDGCEYFIHPPEGAFFLWLWMPEISITSDELYRRLKDRGVYILPGHHFFPGLDEDWSHRHECIRISYSQGSELR